MGRCLWSSTLLVEGPEGLAREEERKRWGVGDGKRERTTRPTNETNAGITNGRHDFYERRKKDNQRKRVSIGGHDTGNVCTPLSSSIYTIYGGRHTTTRRTSDDEQELHRKENLKECTGLAAGYDTHERIGMEAKKVEE